MLVGCGTHVAGSTLPDVPAAATSVEDLGRCLTERAGLAADHLVTLVDPAGPEEFGSALSEVAAEAGDVLFVYYVGHGLVSEHGELHLATGATRDLGQGVAAYQALPYSIVADVIARSRARLVVIVLDCCFSGRARSRSAAATDGAFEHTRRRGTFLLTAAGLDESAWAPPGRHTAFTGELLRLLDEGEPTGPPWLTLNDLYLSLTRTLPSRGLARPRQQSTDQAGTQVIAPNVAYRPPAVPGLPETVPGGHSPYRGLAAFGPDDAPFFFGRDELTRALVERLGSQGTDEGPVVVTGPSGSGKSSLLRAGLIASMRDAGLPGLPRPREMVMAPGSDPWTALARGLARLIDGETASLRARLAEDPAQLALMLSGEQYDQQERLVLLVDQFEELFTACDDEAVRRGFIEALCLAARSGPAGGVRPALVVLGVRADFYGHCAGYPSLTAALERPVIVGPMASDQLRAAIEEPAKLAGLALEPGLADVLLHDLGSGHLPDSGPGGALPLLSHALLATWQRRDGAMLTLAGYHAAGGIEQALANTADAVLNDLGEEGHEPARRMLVRLVRLGDGTEDTRRRVRRADLLPEESSPGRPAAQELLDRFVVARLLTAGDDTIEITHEALIRAWPRLRSWLETDRAGLLLRQRLTDDAIAWQDQGMDPAYLYTGTRLATAAGLVDDDPDAFNALERDFVAAGRRAEGDDLAAAHRRTRYFQVLAGALTVLLAVALVTAVVSVQQRNRANAEQRLGDSRRLAAQAQSYLDTRVDTALLLAVQSSQTADTFESRQALFRMQGASPPPERHIVSRGTRLGTVRISPDGSLLLTEDEQSNQLLVRDLASGRLRWRASLRSSRFPDFTGFTATGTVIAGYLFSGGHPWDVDAWDAHTGRRLASYASLDTRPINPGTAMLSAAGTVLAVQTFPDAQGRKPASVMLWDIRSRRLIRRVPPVSPALSVFGISPDGRYLALLAGETHLRVVDVRTGRVTGRAITLPAKAVSVAVTSDGRRVAADLGPRGVDLFDTRTGRPVGPVPLGTSARGGLFAVDPSVGNLLFSADGSLLTRGGFDGTLKAWNGRGGELVAAPLAAGPSIVNQAVAPTGGSVVTTNGTDRADVWDLNPADRPSTLHAFTSSPEPTAVAPGGDMVAYTSGSGRVTVADARTGRPIGTPIAVPGATSLRALALTRHGEVIVAVDGRNKITLIQRSTGAHRTMTGLVDAYGAQVTGIRLSPGGRYLVAEFAFDALRAGRIVYDTNDFRVVWAADGTKYWTTSEGGVAFSPDGQTVAVGGAGGKIWLVRTPDGATERTLTINADIPTGLAFGRDGTLAASDVLGNVTVLDRTGRVIGKYVGSRGFVTGVSFDASGALLTAVDESGDMIIWDVRSRRPLSPLFLAVTATHNTERYLSNALQLAAGPDYLVVAAAHGEIERFSLGVLPLRTRACLLAGRNLTRAEWQQFVIDRPYRRTCPQWPAETG